ncbi:ATP-binding protein [Janthinobacterium sp.]|uniref:ATP-binding protein n=1 Tax=Janthinobacterium sp. TaxID=1871054 RepID=UPI00293D72CE|nr:ATP-binding protein [Janthinobacterium sp.]
MDIETSSAIKLFFPNPSLTLVYFEAIANALDAEATDIGIVISIQSFTSPETLNIAITDNGKGFTDESFERFKTLMKPKDGFHKGIGRLVFLNYFENVSISSEWECSRRRFTFKEKFDGKSELDKLNEPVGRTNTKLVFKNFAKDKVKSYDDLRPGNLKEKIISHFLLTLNDLRDRDINFKISIKLETQESNSQKEFFSSDVTISSSDLPKMVHLRIMDETVDAHSHIDMYYYIKSDTLSVAHLQTAVSIDGRTIPINLLESSSIPYGNSAVFIFSSILFAASADTSRQKLVLSGGISERALNSTLRREIGLILADLIPEISKKNEKTEKNSKNNFLIY